MKKIIFLTCMTFALPLLLLASPGSAQPEKIEPIAKVAHPQEYYVQQAGLWKEVTDKHASDANAWFNYFRAARYANLLSRSAEKPFDTENIAGKMAAAVPNTFEHQYVRYMAADWNSERFGYLLKAHELAPERTEIYLDLITYHTVTGNEHEAGQFAEKLFQAGEFSSALLAWNFNQLASVEPDAILLTHGDNDTYPSWALQLVKGIRTDVKVLNINLLMHDEYRERTFAALQMQAPVMDASAGPQKQYEAIIRQIVERAQRPVFLATSLPEAAREPFANNLFPTGLAFRFAPQGFDNLAVLKNNFENKFLKDYLKVDFNPDTVSAIMGQMNLNYLPPLLMLHQHYSASGEQVKAQDLESLLRKIALAGGREKEIADYFAPQTTNGPSFGALLSIREMDKQLKKVGPNFFAFDTEVTNEQYEAFLVDLVKNKEFDQLAICKTAQLDWRGMLPAAFKNLPDSEVFKHYHPDGPKAPVVNISHEAARLYCDWLTRTYNASTDKKKAHRNVRFRLPTEQEWEAAARSNLGQDALYPWGGPGFRNAKGCILGNFDVHEAPPCTDCKNELQTKANDGGFFPVMADAYFPNNFGLYNLSGNVAEMVAEKGIAKGGSWQDPPAECTIFSKKQYTGPGPGVGFRVFMEIRS